MTTAYPDDYLSRIYDEPDPSPDALANLGPLAALAGVWEGGKGVDVHPQVDGPEREPYVERWTFEILDPQTNGPQLYYGLRYHQHVTRPDDVETFHDQVGHLMWEPATGSLVMSLSIPRGQVALAGGSAEPSATRFALSAREGDPNFAITSAPFLQAAFRTSAWDIEFRVKGDQLAYTQTTTLHPHGDAQPFAHTDANILTRVGQVPANPLAGGPVLR